MRFPFSAGSGFSRISGSVFLNDCFSTQIELSSPSENTLSLTDYNAIDCPGNTTDLNFTIEGSIGQFDIFVDGK